jgi:CheY-like chemotaxis protein
MFGFTKDSLRDWDILVVEDEPDSLEVATRWLKLAGATVLTADNGKKGLEAARQHHPRLILADLTMPVMDGWELLYELKQQIETAGIPVIALTAHAMPTTKVRTLEAGFVAHISKPINPQKFVSQILSIINSVPELAAQLPG